MVAFQATFTNDPSKALREVHLSHNFIKANGLRTIVRAAAKCGVYPVLKESKDETTLKPLYIRVEQNYIDEQDTK